MHPRRKSPGAGRQRAGATMPFAPSEPELLRPASPIPPPITARSEAACHLTCDRMRDALASRRTALGGTLPATLRDNLPAGPASTAVLAVETGRGLGVDWSRG